MSDIPSSSPAEQTLEDVAVMLVPLVRWLVGHGVPLHGMTQLLKTLYLREGYRELSQRNRRVTDSALSVLTGVHRKDVKTFMDTLRMNPHEAMAPVVKLSPTPAAMLFTLWITDPRYRVAVGGVAVGAQGADAAGVPTTDQGVLRVLPRQGAAPSFEALAREVSSDVHPRTLLQELERLGLVQAEGDSVQLLVDRFVPPVPDRTASHTMAVNVADHLASAVHNLNTQAPESRYLEQSVFADGLSPESVEALGQLARTLWGGMLDSMVREGRQRLESDMQQGRERGQRMRLGVYFYQEAPPSQPSRSGGGTGGRAAGKLSGER